MKNAITPIVTVLQKCSYRLQQRVLAFVRNAVAGALLYTQCLCCGKAAKVVPLCAACKRALFDFLPFKASSRCRICGKILLSEDGLCMQCRAHPVLQHITAAFPLHSYILWKKALLHVWKAENCRSLSPLFASVCARALSALYAQLGARFSVVPVPPRPGKIRRTGWDQIAELCAHLKHGYGVQILPLLRRRSRMQQKKLSRQGRLQSASYTLSRAALRLKAHGALPQSVVLVDDVLTTGATLESCAAALKSAGVQQVYAITLFAAG